MANATHEVRSQTDGFGLACDTSLLRHVETWEQGFDAMMKGEGDIVTGLKNKLQAAVAHVTPAAALAEMHRTMAEPKSGDH